MDKEKIIRIIDELIFEAQKEPHGKLKNALRCLKNELLKEQEAVKPIYNEEKYGDHLPHCKNCEKVLPNNAVYGKVNFCHHCGQAVKWI